MKKAVIIIFIILYFGMFYVNAAENEILLKIYVKDDCKIGKAFNLYISLNCEVEIGASRLSVLYDKNSIALKNVSLEEKTYNDIISYNDNGGEVDIIYISQNNQNIVLRFQPINLQTTQYNFETFIYEACDLDGNYIKSNKICKLSLSVTNEKIVQNQSIENMESRTEQKSLTSEFSEISKKTDKSEVSERISNPYAEKVDEETSESEESSQTNIYHVIHEKNNTNQNDFFIFAGIAIVIAVCFVLVYKSGFKNGKETEKKTSK